MSYRTVKRLLGETSLERKCRFLFGGGLMILITGSFYFYARLNLQLIDDNNELRARYLVGTMLLHQHWKYTQTEIPEFNRTIDLMANEIKPEDLPKEYQWNLYAANTTTAEAKGRPPDAEGYKALEALRQGDSKYIHIDQENGKYNYYAGLRASKSCLSCHYHKERDVQDGDLIGMAQVSLPLENIKKAVATNNAILLTTAIVTAFLAMLAAYAIVRYVIVKPVLHLKEVSDGIARGTLDLRADIRTGDEFEELSHAFNRMLRHLVTVQDELREVNTHLDGKVDDLAQVNLRLYEMNKLKDEFLATMSHELRTPLNSILGFSDVLANSDNLTDKQKRFLVNIQSSGRDLMRLIDDLLDLAKIESGKMELEIREFLLSDLVEQQIAAMMPIAARKNIDLGSQIDADMPRLYQDAGKLQQILNNLLSNAVKFTPEGGRVRVRAVLEGEMFSLIVEDTGIGIPLEEQGLIFEKFRQGKSIPGQRDTMTREYGGTGLGLSIVKELSKLLGGEVLLDSEFGKGSTFTVRLPLRLDEQARQLEADLQDQLLSSEPAVSVDTPIAGHLTADGSAA